MRYLTIEDLRRQAHRIWPAAIRDYVEGGADAQITLRRNAEVFGRYEFRPRLLAGGSRPDLRTSVLGRPANLPFALGPTGYSRLIHPAGEIAIARAAARAGIAYTASTMATTTVTEVAAAEPNADIWLQVYVFADRSLTKDLIQRAADAGCRTIVLTVDSAITGSRPVFARHGMIPPAPSRALVLRSLARNPRWAVRYLRAGQLAAPHLSPLTGQAGLLATDHMAFEPALSWADVAEVRDQWPGRLLLKGPLRADDVRQAVAIGADGVVLSNHGGRQLDQLPPPLQSLREVRDAVGDSAAVLVDSGFRRGGDIAIALALGADAVLIGRPYVYGLGAEGEPGVDLALRILTEELSRTMLLLGVSSVAELRSGGAELVRTAAFR